MSLRVAILAGEPSGDRLGGALMAGLVAERPAAFLGVGGQDMAAAGLESLFPMSDLTVMGIAEVLPRLPLLLRRIREASEAVTAARPDVLVTIDSPDFTLRVARRVRHVLPDLPVVHYVAPSVWAWRPGRAAKMARHVDHVLCLLPFEPPYMHAAGMTAEFVGHPVAVRTRPSGAEVSAFREGLGIAPGTRTLLLAPGSRRGEVARLLPVFLETLSRLRAEMPGTAVLCPVAETVEAEVRAALGGVADVHLVGPAAGPEAKAHAFAAADAALCASGTITLELAAAGTPMVAAYRTSWLTAAIVRRLVKVDTANLVNLVTGARPVPEYLQERCTPENLADALSPLLSDPGAGTEQRAAFDAAMQALGRGGTPPGLRAARSVLTMLQTR